MSPGQTSGPRLALLFGALMVLGIPLVAYLWETVNHLLALRFDTGRLLLSAPLALLLFLLLRAAARAFSRMGAPLSPGE